MLNDKGLPADHVGGKGGLQKGGTGHTLSVGVGRGRSQSAGQEGRASAHQLGCMPLRTALQLHEEQLALMPTNHNYIPPHPLHCPHLQGQHFGVQLAARFIILQYAGLYTILFALSHTGITHTWHVCMRNVTLDRYHKLASEIVVLPALTPVIYEINQI